VFEFDVMLNYLFIYPLMEFRLGLIPMLEIIILVKCVLHDVFTVFL